MPDISSSDAATYVKAVGQALLTPLRTLAHTGTEAVNLITGTITTATGTLLTSKLNDDALNVVGVAKKFYPQMGAIINAIIRMGENNAYLMRYDLAQDPLHLMPKDMIVRGVVIRDGSYGARFKLNNGYIEGLGDVQLQFNVYSSNSCYYYCYYSERAYAVASVKGVDADINITANDIQIYRNYSYYAGHRVLSSADIRNADVNVTLALGATRVHLSGKNSLSLSWPSSDMQRLPTVASFSANGAYRRYDNTQDIRLPSVYLSYSNNNYFYYQAYNMVEWAHRQTDYFTLTVGLQAQIKDTRTTSNYANYQTVNLEIGATRTPYNYNATTGYYDRDYRRQWIQIGDGTESYKFESTLANSPRYAFYTQSGAMVEMLKKNDGKTFESGVIKFRDHVVGTISDSKAGPIVRFNDGTMQSF